MKNALKKGINLLNQYWFMFVFFAVLFYGLYGNVIDRHFEKSSGVVEELDKVDCTVDTIMAGDFQTYLGDFWDKSLPGKNFLVHVRNQLIYSVCKQSPNANVTIGKDGYLFEPTYINFEYGLTNPITDEYCKEMIEKITKFRKLLSENGKELYFFITPSKADFEEDKIPWRYKFLKESGKISSASGREKHKKMIEIYEKSAVNYFDAVQWIKENKNAYHVPVYYKSGIHWSNVWGEAAASELINYISETGDYELRELLVKDKTVEEPVAPSTDLYSSLNLLCSPKEKWYSTDIVVTKEGKDKPNVFMRGGSFMGQSLNKMITSDVFAKDVYLENYYYFTDKFTKQEFLDSYDSYDAMPLDSMLGETDIVIIEVNDMQIGGISFGFIDYCLEHPEYMDKTY